MARRSVGLGPHLFNNDGYGRVLNRAIEIVWIVDLANLATWFAEPNGFTGGVGAARRHTERVRPLLCQTAQLDQACAVTSHVRACGKRLRHQVVVVRFWLTGPTISPTRGREESARDDAGRIGVGVEINIVEEPTSCWLRAIQDAHVVVRTKGRFVGVVPRMSRWSGADR